ncbi:helix-turn-helix domain-containing protein [Halalkalibacter nanhaiisediminis]|nr:helix-turn-helix domain-containing protein [Halalkalibacter nanhaiisediminis]
MLRGNEKQLIERALQTTDNLSEVARKLGISRSTLYRKIKAYAISQ